MKKWFHKYFQRYMIRPVIYQVFTRAVMGLTASLVWNTFTNTGSNRQPLGNALLVVGIFYGVCAWMAYLRLDGIKAPKFDRELFQFKKKDPIRAYGDMSDFTDEQIVSFEELEPEEKDHCLLLSNLLCLVGFAAASIIYW